MTSPVSLIANTAATTAPIAGSASNPSAHVHAPVHPTGNPSGTTGGGTSNTGSAAGTAGLLPILDGSYGPDGRFAVLSVPTRPGDKPYPQGTIGIMIPGTKENSQESLFFPSLAATGADLVAVNAAGDPSMGSLVADLDNDNHIDLTRRAPLQSAWWVIKGEEENGETNSLAWNIGESGRGDVYGGFVIDSPASNGTVVHGTKVVACVSVHQGGFMDVGGPSDKHQIHVDGDGRTINACHISTGALFRADDKLDGPLMFENTLAPAVKCMPINVPVHLGYDIALGAWRWWAQTIIFVTTPPTPPPEPPPPEKPPWIIDNPNPKPNPNPNPNPPWAPRNPPRHAHHPNPHHAHGGTPHDPPPPGDDGEGWIPPPVNPEGTTPTGSGGSTPRDGAGIIDNLIDRFMQGRPSFGTTYAAGPSDPPQSHASCPLQLAAPSFVARPAATGANAPDISSNPNPTPQEIEDHDATAPVTCDMVAFGKGSDQGKWSYTTRPGASRWKGGTADGGFVFLAPEASLLLQDPSARNRPTSRSLVTAGPNVRWGAGAVDLTSGHLDAGYTWRNVAGTLTFETVASTASTRDAVTFAPMVGTVKVNVGAASDVAFEGTVDAPALVPGTNVDSPTVKLTGHRVLGGPFLQTFDWTQKVQITASTGGSNLTTYKQTNGGGYTPQFSIVDAAGIILYTNTGKKGFQDVGSLVTADRTWKWPDLTGRVLVSTTETITADELEYLVRSNAGLIPQ